MPTRPGIMPRVPRCPPRWVPRRLRAPAALAPRATANVGHWLSTPGAPPPPSLWTIRPDVAGALSSCAAQLAGVVETWEATGQPMPAWCSRDATILEAESAALLSFAGRVGNSAAAYAAARDAVDYVRSALYGTAPGDPTRALPTGARHLYARRALGELAALRLACHAALPMPPAPDVSAGFR